MNETAPPIVGPSTPAAGGDDTLTARVSKSSQAWRRLGLWLRSVTPSGLARLLLAAGAVAAVIWVMNQTIVSLTPFLVGLALAYITAPIVEALDKLMPRGLAVFLVIVGEILILLLVVAILIIPLGRELSQIIQNLPDREQIRAFFDRAAKYVGTLPEPTQVFIRDALQQATVRLRENLGNLVQQAADLSLGAVLGLLRTFGFVIGLLVLPTWLGSVMADQKRGKRALERALPGWAKADFWAVVRIVDRTLSASLRGLVLQAIAVAAVTYVGLSVLDQFGLLAIKYKLLWTVLAGIMELIPDVGPFLWIVPAAVVGLSNSPAVAVSQILIYVIGRWLVQRVFVARITERAEGGIHPAFLVVAIVALSQFGFVWLFLAVPATVIARDLLVYVYGRVSTPPRLAGLLPGDPMPVPQTARSTPARQAFRRRNGAPSDIRARQKGRPAAATESEV